VALVSLGVCQYIYDDFDDSHRSKI
jgi:hypothetical protein